LFIIISLIVNLLIKIIKLFIRIINLLIRVIGSNKEFIELIFLLDRVENICFLG